MVKHLQPELGAVFWDEGLPEKRMILQPAYKETRKEMPQPMVPQLDYIQDELTALLGFKNISLPNTEADDLMGCYAMAACKRKHRSRPGDERQGPVPARRPLREGLHDRQSRPAFAERRLRAPRRTGGHGEMGGAAESDRRRPRAFRRFGRQHSGRRLRPKNRRQALPEHGGLDALLANIDKVKSERSREKLMAGREQIEQNRKMVELDCDTPLPVPIDDLRIKPDYPALIAALEKCEFKSLLQEVRDEAAKARRERPSRLNCFCSSGPVGRSAKCIAALERLTGPLLQKKSARRQKERSDPRLHNSVKIFRTAAPLAVKIYRLRRFGRRHVSRICCFSCVRCPNPFFVGKARPFPGHVFA